MVPVARERAFRNRNDRRGGDRERKERRRLETFFEIKVCDITFSYIDADFLITSVTISATPFRISSTAASSKRI